MLSHYPIEEYTPDRIQNAFLIIHPKILERYEITLDEFHGVFERGSNFSQLKYPIVDEHGIFYHDSEGYYMAQRFDDLDVKRAISKASQIKGKSKAAAYEHFDDMEQDPEKRIAFMKRTIEKKYDGSKWRRQMLLDTAGREIIEFTYWWDEFFGISHDHRQGRNILGKLHMEYRDRLLEQLR